MESPAHYFAMRPVSELTPYPNNSRTHSAAQIKKIAAAITQFGFLNPVIIDKDSGIIAGHGRVMAAELLGMEEVPTVQASHLTDAQRKAYIIADNKIALDAGWDDEILRFELESLVAEGFDIDVIGFTEEDYQALELPNFTNGLIDDDELPPVIEPVTRAGDLWQLGNHRLLCGDSTDEEDIDLLMDGQTAILLHADPPYGMGKENEGVVNDNLYGDELDAFQTEWFTKWRPHLQANASFYIWGMAMNLWRWWFKKLIDLEMTFKNQIVWAKGNTQGMKTKSCTMYPPETEYCFFFVQGDQMQGSLNQDQFFEGFARILNYLMTEADAVGLKPKKLRQITGLLMYSHWFSRSQFTLIPENHYKTLQEEYQGNFVARWSKLKAAFDKAGAILLKTSQASRSYFDNTHENMSDVWRCSTPSIKDRNGHATPKPIELMERIVLSSSSRGTIVAEPFAGSGSTLIACEKAERICYTMEIVPAYCDIVVQRWQAYTGELARNEQGQTFNELRIERDDAGRTTQADC